jgi:hypothetical protein
MMRVPTDGHCHVSVVLKIIMMHFKLIGPWPTCKGCGCRMDYWSPYMQEYECVPCTANRISDVLIQNVMKQISQSMDTLHKGSPMVNEQSKTS